MDYKEILQNEETKTALFNTLKENGFDVLDEQRKNELIANVTSEKITEAVKKRELELKNGYEKDIQELIGEPKQTNEKTHEYLKRVLGGSLAKAKELEEKLKSNLDSNEAIRQIQDAFAKKESEYIAKLQETENKIVNSKKESVLNESLSKLKFNKDLQSEYIELKIEKLKANLLNKISFDDKGNAILLDENGAVLRNQNNNMNPFTLQEKLASELESLLDKGRNVPGAGTNPPSNTPTSSGVAQDLESMVLQSAPKSDTEILKIVQDYYIKKGLSPRSPEATKAFAVLSNRLGF